MRKRWKRSFVTALSMALAVGNCVPAMAAPTGWRESAAGWQYVNSNGSVQKGWFQDTKGDWYFLDYNTGIMKTGWIKPKDGKWYFMDYHTGAMKTGWIKPADGKWYYLNPNSNGTKGAMMTGWVQTPDKKWYYMDAASGAMQTGTITVNNQVWTLDANGVWDGKAATSITYVSSNRRPSGGSSGGSGSTTTTTTGWKGTLNNGKVDVEINAGTFDTATFIKEFEKKYGKKDINNLTIKTDQLNKEISDLPVITGNLEIAAEVGDGDVSLSNVEVQGDTLVNGGGNQSIHFKDCRLLGNLTTNKTVNVNPLRILFKGSTKVEKKVTIGGSNVVVALGHQAIIPEIIASTSIVVTALPEASAEEKALVVLPKLVITTSITICLDVKVETVQVNTTENVTIDTTETGEIQNPVEGSGKDTVVVEGDGKVKGYYDVVLNAGEGSWTIIEIDDTGKETEKSVSTKTIKAAPTDKLVDVIKSSGDITPNKAGSTLAGWYEKADFTGEEVDLTQEVGENKVELFAKWDETGSTEITPVVSSITATIASGSSVTVDSGEINVTDGAATLNLTTATGSSVTATGAAVLADIKLGATAKNGETPVTGTITWDDASDTEIKSGTTYNATFTATSTGTTEIYTPVPIKITIVIK